MVLWYMYVGAGKWAEMNCWGNFGGLDSALFDRVPMQGERWWTLHFVCIEPTPAEPDSVGAWSSSCDWMAAGGALKRSFYRTRGQQD